MVALRRNPSQALSSSFNPASLDSTAALPPEGSPMAVRLPLFLWSMSVKAGDSESLARWEQFSFHSVFILWSLETWWTLLATLRFFHQMGFTWQISVQQHNFTHCWREWEDVYPCLGPGTFSWPHGSSSNRVSCLPENSAVSLDTCLC